MGIRISVVVATLNCEKVIEQFLKSYAEQDYADRELIVIDGGSSDDTLKIVERYRSETALIISEKDRGVYDAYNKGIERASGDYAVFFGADDAFYDKRTLSNVAKTIVRENAPDLLCTTVLYVDRAWAYIEKKRVLYGWEEGLKRKQPMIPHQGLYAKTEILREHPFSLRYDISSDLEFYLYCHKTRKNIKYIDRVTAFFSRQGLSSNNEIKRKREENEILAHYGEENTEDHGGSELRRKLRQWLCRYKAGMILMIRFRGFRIHKCGNACCRWCAYNRMRIRKRDRRYGF